MTTSHPWLARYADGDAEVQLSPACKDGLSLFRHAVDTDPDAPAICYFDRVLSYAEVDQLSDAFAGWLASIGVGAGDRVALYLQNVPQFPICLLGAWKIGAIGVSINPMNRSRELTLLLEDSGARVLVAHRDLYEDVAREVLKQFPQGVCVTTSAREFQSRNDARCFAEPDRAPPKGTIELADALDNAPAAPALRRGTPPEHPAVIVYTSGTTGIPKGAVVTHWNFASDAELWRLWAHLPNGGPVLAIAPLFHITGLVGHL
jgi:long-chain acyl-CoA synthetase